MNNLSGETLPLTIKALNAQKIFYTLLITPSPPKNTLMKKQRTIPSQDEFRSVKLHLIELYFNCYGLIFPVLVKPYYYSLAIKDPDSLLSTILVAIVTHSHCVHINLKNYNWSRQQVAERVRKEAVEKLSNVLFEMESTVELCFCLWVLANIHIYVLHIRQARIYSSLCWRMATELKSVYLPILQNPSHFNGVDCIRAETWRRLLYMIRYLEYNMCMVHDECKNMSPVAHHIEIGFPMVLACEKPMPDVLNAVQSFHFVARLTVNAANPSFVSSETELLGLKLITGGLDNVSSILYHRLETGLLDLWKSIPAWMQVGNGPFHYTESQDIKCREPTILRMNGVYYVYWMTLQARLMQYPSTTDLKGASLERMDGDRALIITSITTDTITKIFALLHTLLPCSLEMHWITMCVDVLKLLSISIHPTVKQKADANIEILMGIVQDHLRSITGKNNCKNSPSTPFLNEMKQRLENLYKCK
jgi:hypothetical protein